MKKIITVCLFLLLFTSFIWSQKSTEKCSDDNKFCHKAGELNWSDKSDDVYSWKEAGEYCKKIGGRLPTISELRSIIKECPPTQTGGECKVADQCLIYNDCRDAKCIGCILATDGKYSQLGDIGWFWSSSTPSEDSFGVWTVRFDYGLVAYSRKNFDKRHVRCVK